MSVTILPARRYELPSVDHGAADDDDDMMQLDGGVDDHRSLSRVTIPGDSITTDAQFMRGHGTYVLDEAAAAAAAGPGSGAATDVRSSVLGSVSRVNKLLSVVPSKARFNPEIGDLAIGVVREVGLRKWRVDIASRCDATLQLASINLPGGIQRRKTGADELQMRTFFQEGDLVLAEVQSYFHDGSVSLHTRSLKYGKLRNGQFARVSPGNVARAKQSAVQLGAVDLVIGNNGYCFIALHSDTSLSASGGGAGANVHNNTSQEASEAIYSDVNAEIPHAAREEIARIHNLLVLLDEAGVRIDVDAVARALEASRIVSDAAAILRQDVRESIIAQVAFG